MFDDSVILITGATGSWGHELVSQLLSDHAPREIRIYSRGEHRQVEMKEEFSSYGGLKFIIGDVRDKNILRQAMMGCDFVFHLAALKHVPVCEENGWEAVLTNIFGTQNIIEAAIDLGVKVVVDISTDKAVEPHNQYGVTKSCGEKLMVNANHYFNHKTKFVCIRGGNVIGTNGSVLPLFRRQIAQNNIITITDPSMTRYLMSTRQAVELIFKAVNQALGGEIFVMRMPSVTVHQIADAMIELYGNDQTKRAIIGARPGEKHDEVLVSEHEAPRTRVVDNDYYVILPEFNLQVFAERYRDLLPMDLPKFTSANAQRLKFQDLCARILHEGRNW